jgi:hypothetical protein
MWAYADAEEHALTSARTGIDIPQDGKFSATPIGSALGTPGHIDLEIPRIRKAARPTGLA